MPSSEHGHHPGTDPAGHHENYKSQTVVGVEAALNRFQDRQRTLSRKVAIKESWKAICWCS